LISLEADRMLTKVVKGVYFRQINNTVIYQKSVPLTFVIVDLPKINPMLKSSNCSAEPEVWLLENKSTRIHQAVITETVKDHPYLVAGNSRVSRA